MQPLSDHGLPIATAIERELDVYLAMGAVRQIASRLGCNAVDRTKLEIIVLELARNILIHARAAGQIQLSLETRRGRAGLLIRAADRGAGIADLAAALRDGYSTAGTLGAGLPGVQRLADEFSISSAPGSGTTVLAWKAIAAGGSRR